MAMKLYRHWTQVPPWLWELCPSFHPTTDPMLVSPDTGAFQFDVESMQALQAYRNIMGPTSLNSGYRSEIYNARLPGSSPTSEHFRKFAADLHIGFRNRHDMKEAALQAGFTGIGMYRTFMHVDKGARREWFGSAAARDLW